VLAALLAVFFDLSRIASLGAIFYLVMDIAIHWGVYRHLRHDVGAKGWSLLRAIALDAVALGAFLAIKSAADPLIVIIGIAAIIVIVAYKWFYWHRLRGGGVTAAQHKHNA